MASMASQTFAFGKHKGRTFEEVSLSEPGYCSWVLGLDGPSGAMKNFADFLRARGFSSAGGGGGGGGGSGPGMGGNGWSVVPKNTPMSFGREFSNASLICELFPGNRFLVRGERRQEDVIQSPAFSSGARKAMGVSGAGSGGGYIPQDVWQAIGQLDGAKAASGGERRGWHFPLSLYSSTVENLERIATRVDKIPDWVIRVVRSSGDKQGEASLKQDRLPAQLLPYQVEGVRFGVAHRGRCLIGDEMGLGKTLQALAIAAQYTEDWPVLVVCPSTLRFVWREQVLEWLCPMGLLDEDEVQVIKKGKDMLSSGKKFWIVSYNILAADSKAQNGNFQVRPDGTPHKFLIVDESHHIKDWSADRTKAVVPLARRAARTVLLSGTPTRNAADELHTQLWAVLPSFSPKMEEFRSRYCLVQERPVFGGRTIKKVVGSRNTYELNHLLTSSVMVRRLKKEVMSQLPTKRRQKVPLEVGESKLMKEIRGQMKATNWMDTQGDFADNVASESVQTMFHTMAQAKLPAVKEYLLEALDRCNEKIIIFAHHKLVMDGIQEHIGKRLTKDGLAMMRIDGTTSAAKRVDLVKRFQTDATCRVALLSITACSEGLTLTAAQLVIFAELYWVPGAVEQAEARAHRIGSQHTKVVVEFLVAPGTPDESIYKSLERKKQDTSRILDGATETLDAEEQAMRPRTKKRPLDAMLHKKESRQTEDKASAAPTTGTPPRDAHTASPGAGIDGADRDSSAAEDGNVALSTPPPAKRAAVTQESASKAAYLLRAIRGSESVGFSKAF